MKILHVIDSLNVGGAEKVCIYLLSMLRETGHEADCMVITSKGPLHEKIDKRARLFFLNRKRKFSLIKMYKCAMIASEYDIIHVHMRHTWAYVKLSSLIFNSKLKLIFHDHFWGIRTPLDANFRLTGIFKPQFYVGVSYEHRKWAKENLKISDEHLFVLRNTILPDYGQSNIYFGDLLMISNLREVKNVLFAIRLANYLKRRLTIFGNTDGSHYADMVLKEGAKSEYITIIQGESEIQKHLSNFSLAIHTSIYETGPLVLLEYMAHGLPFITYKVGSVVEEIADKFPDMIIESFQLDDWEVKINLLEGRIKNGDKELSSDLIRVFEEKFSPDDYLNKCLKIYQNVLSC